METDSTSIARAGARRVEMRIDSDTSQIADARRIMEGFAASAGFSEIATGEIGLCVNEALANIIRHAYGGAPERPIHLAAELTMAGAPREEEVEALRLTIRDWGSGKNPAECPPKPRDPIEPGGVGMICLRELMDEVVFSPQPDGMLVTMVKRQEHA